MTLLERFDKPDYLDHVTKDEIRRALAESQAVREFAAQDVAQGGKSAAHHMLRRADELLEGK